MKPSAAEDLSRNDRKRKVIIHLDLDCFYAQVEMNRLGVPYEDPFVVVQWGGLIAVNYAARAFGVSRFGPNGSLDKALELVNNSGSQQLSYCHVATYAHGEKEYHYHMDHVAHTSSAKTPNRWAMRKDTHKVALQPYRLASQKIFELLHSFSRVGLPQMNHETQQNTPKNADCPDILIEKVGIDEAFLDVTSLAKARLKLKRDCNEMRVSSCTGHEDCEMSSESMMTWNVQELHTDQSGENNQQSPYETISC